MRVQQRLGRVLLQGLSQGPSPQRHSPHWRCPHAHPGEQQRPSLPPSLPPPREGREMDEEKSTCQEGNSGCLLRCGGSSFSPGDSSPRPPSCLGCPSAGSWISPIRHTSRRGPGAGRAHHGAGRARSATLRARSDTNFSARTASLYHLFKPRLSIIHAEKRDNSGRSSAAQAPSGHIWNRCSVPKKSGVCGERAMPPGYVLWDTAPLVLEHQP